MFRGGMLPEVAPFRVA